MRGSAPRTLRIIVPGEQAPRTIDYWRTRSMRERLEATFALHHEGNALFKGGNRPFVYVWRFRHDGVR